MAYIQIEDKLSGWLASRERDDRKDSIRKVIGKLHELSYGLFPKDLLAEHDKIPKFNSNQELKAQSQSSSFFYRTNLLSERQQRKRLTHASFKCQSAMVQKYPQQPTKIEPNKVEGVTQLMNQSVLCLKVKTFEMPKPKTKYRRRNKLFQSKPQVKQDSPNLSHMKYQKRRSLMYRRKPQQLDRSSKYILRDNIIKMLQQNFKVRSYSRLSHLN